MSPRGSHGGSGSLSWLMIRGGALWLHLCNYSLFHELLLSASVSTPSPPSTSPVLTSATFRNIFAVGYASLSIFSCCSFSDLPLAFIPPFACFFLLSLSLFPFLARPRCLLQINFALIYAPLSSQGSVLHIHHLHSWVRPHGWTSRRRTLE